MQDPEDLLGQGKIGPDEDTEAQEGRHQKQPIRSGELAQHLSALTAPPRGPMFNSQQPHGGSQPFIMRYGALFWTAGGHAGRMLYL